MSVQPRCRCGHTGRQHAYSNLRTGKSRCLICDCTDYRVHPDCAPPPAEPVVFVKESALDALREVRKRIEEEMREEDEWSEECGHRADLYSLDDTTAHALLRAIRAVLGELEP